jgi:DNA modification methylase
MTPRTIWYVNDTLAQLAAMPASSVDLVFTSPPFLQLRRYLPPGHEHEHLEIGREQSPAEFVDRLLDVTEACARVLAPHGTLCFELGDTSSGSGGAGGDWAAGGTRHGATLSGLAFSGSAAAMRGVDKRHKGRQRAGGESPAMKGARTTRSRTRAAEGLQVPHHATGGVGWPLEKSLCGIPEAFRLSLMYGFNVLRPEQLRLTDRWIVRNVISWVRNNPPPGDQRDKFRRGTTTIVVATKSKTRWWDDLDVRTPLVENRRRVPKATGRKGGQGAVRSPEWGSSVPATGTGALPLDWWFVPSSTYRPKGTKKHYAAFPPNLCTRPILAMCPPRVCTWCGRAPVRIKKPAEGYAQKLGRSLYPKTQGITEVQRQIIGKSGAHAKDITAFYEHDGWDECDCPDVTGRWRRGVVLDPFAGTGTTCIVANSLGRDSIGIDFNSDNVDIVTERFEQTDGDWYLNIHDVLGTKDAA